MLLLQNVPFEINENTRNTAFYIFHSDNGDETLEVSIDIEFRKNILEENTVSPSLVINPIKTNATEISELRDMSFEVKNLEESDEREDCFYIYEHEPFENYVLSIVAIMDNKIRLKCKGKVITDGYATPYKVSNFELDCWLPIISCKNDWEKFGL